MIGAVARIVLGLMIGAVICVGLVIAVCIDLLDRSPNAAVAGRMERLMDRSPNAAVAGRMERQIGTSPPHLSA